jgi:methylmalonyl-CoA/ethylmalonyl-CoA epimerase
LNSKEALERMVLDHITIAVEDLEKSKALFERMFPHKLIKEITLPRQNARAAFYLVGETIVGLESPLSEEGDIYKFLKRKGEGIHHLAFNVNDLDFLQEELKEQVQLIGYSVKTGVRKEIFTHPKSLMGLLLQLMEWEEPYKSSLEKRLEILGEE